MTLSISLSLSISLYLSLSPDDSSSESGSGNGLPTVTPPSAGVATPPDSSGGKQGASYGQVVNGNGPPAPLDFSTTSSSSSEDQQPINLSERLPVAAAALLGALLPEPPDELRRKYPVPGKPLPLPLPLAHPHAAELRLDRDIRDYGSKVSSHTNTHTHLNTHTHTHTHAVPSLFPPETVPAYELAGWL